jgi:peroxiredoxin
MGIVKDMAVASAVCWMAAPASAAVEVGKPAPEIVARDIENNDVNLASLKGKIVVLEWNNPDCPFVKKFYDSGTMQKLQADDEAKGVVWIAINSSSVGKQGYMDNAAAKTNFGAKGIKAGHYILDPEGMIGHAYDAKTTPHMFVVDKAGNIAYAGAIDDRPSTNADDIAGATNYITAALDSLFAGKPVAVSSSKAYGCGVKY